MKTEPTAPVAGWKLLARRDGQIVSVHGDQVWTVGEWAPPVTNPRLGPRGYHDCLTILDTFGKVPGTVLARTDVRGAAHLDARYPDERCHAEMRLVAAYRWSPRDAVALAVFAAELVLHIYEDRYPADDRPRKAIAAAKAYLAGQPADAHATYAAANAAASTNGRPHAAAVATGPRSSP